MNFAMRSFLGYFVLLALVLGLSINWILEQIHRPMSQSKELMLVDTANLLAEFALPHMLDNTIVTGDFAQHIRRYSARQQNASIYGAVKQGAGLRVYITNIEGIVIFDSAEVEVGKDYSQWRDVYLTLRGQYGARSSPSAPGSVHSVMHVGAPIMNNGRIIGTLTVSAPNETLDPFVRWAKKRILESTVSLTVIALIVGLLLALWTGRGVRQLARYASATSEGQRVPLPSVGGRELQHLAHAIDNMRQKLDGKAYVENYVQLLTHELKSPLSGIRGAAELLQDPLSPDIHQKLIENIESDAGRMQAIIDNLLLLARLEHQQALKAPNLINVKELFEAALKSRTATAQQKQISMSLEVDDAIATMGDRFLLEQAIGNLLDNALDFTPTGGEIHLSADMAQEAGCVIRIHNSGPAIPDYALPRLFERFYSLPRPDNQKKGTGLGLVLVKEVAHLHQGHISLHNVASGGVEARLTLHTHSTESS